jgi:hypothetical protein
MYVLQFQCGPGSVWSVPGTWTWPTMCVRFLGMPYLSAMLRVSAAEARYIWSVNHEALSTKPSCSMPTERLL